MERKDAADSQLAHVNEMTIAGQSEAKRFLVGKILEQAHLDGIKLSQAEAHMLSWSESDPDFTPDPRLAEALADEMSDDQFEEKVSGLIRRAFDRDVAADDKALARYRQVRKALQEGDHYILVMMNAALTTKLRTWWPF